MISKSLFMGVGVVMVVSFSACAIPGAFESTKFVAPTVTPTPTPKPPEKKVFEVWKCTITNGEGRLFYANHESRYEAEVNAKRECSIYSRHCSVLECTPTTEESDSI